MKKWNTAGNLQMEQFVEYCTNPVAVFTREAAELKRIHIDDEIVQLGDQAKRDIAK